MIDWNPHLLAGEKIRWEGRPAPRCYTFRHWRWSLAGGGILALLGGWQEIAAPLGVPHLPGEMVRPLAILALLFFIGLPLWQRLAWERILYAISDHRLLMVNGCRVKGIPLKVITAVHLQSQGDELGTLCVEGSDGQRSTLFCLEYPRVPIALLKSED